jgi:hypothetical protein
MGASFFTGMGNFQQFRAPLYRARASHHHHIVATNGHPAHLEDGIYWFELAAGSFVGFADGHDGFHTNHSADLPYINHCAIANHANHTATLTDNGMGFAA